MFDVVEHGRVTRHVVVAGWHQEPAESDGGFDPQGGEAGGVHPRLQVWNTTPPALQGEPRDTAQAPVPMVPFTVSYFKNKQTLGLKPGLSSWFILLVYPPV